MSYKIKAEFKHVVIGYNHSAVPLGQRNDLHLLYQLGAKDPSILNYFEETGAAVEAAGAKESAENFIAKHSQLQDVKIEVEPEILPAPEEEREAIESYPEQEEKPQVTEDTEAVYQKKQKQKS